MMKPKVALVKSGFLPAGSENKRGRLSAAAIAECVRLVAEEDYVIEGYVSSKPARAKNDKTVDDSPVTVTKEKVATSSNEIVQPFYRYGENGVNTHEAVTADGRVFDLRQACSCGYSLSGHRCNAPQILTGNGSNHEPVTVRLKSISK
jgi:hypothetical protein